MSRRPHPSPTPPEEGSAADDLRRLALERRDARLAARSGRSVAAPAPITAPAAPVIETIVPVAGMTCRACEVRIARHVGKVPGVERVTVSAPHGRVVITSSAPVSAMAVEAAIRQAGYEVGATPWLERDRIVWVTAAAGVALVAVVAMIARMTGLTDLAADTGSLADGGLVVALVLGLAAGVSTCAALVGGLVLALSASFQARGATGGTTATAGLVSRLRPALVFVGGRIAGYGLLGALLGAIGAGITMPPAMTAALMIVAAIVMAVAGARLTGLSPRIAAWSPTLPMGLGRRLGLVPADGQGPVYSDARAGLLGAATFFLPCGFTQAVQVYALSTGSPLIAGTVMAVFAIGTAPGLLAMAGLPIVVPSSVRPTLLRIAGVAVLAFALLNATAGLRLAGISLPGFGPGTAAAAALPSAGVATDGTQALTTYQDADGYSPAAAAIYAGAPTRWTVMSSTTATCAAFLVVPSLGISVRLHEGANVIQLPALPAGRLDYSCAMGMYGGAIDVIAPEAAGNSRG